MINKVAGTTTALMIILLGLLGLGNLGMAFDYSITSYLFWFHIVIGILLLFIAWAWYRVVGDYERLTNRYLDVLREIGYSDLDDYFEKQEERRELEAKRQAERKQSFANVSTEELLAFKEKYQNNTSIVSIVDRILEARGKATKEF